MTKKERLHPELLSNASRLRRISVGSGTTLTDVRNIVTRFYGMRNMMKKASKSPGMLANLPGFKQLNMLKQIRGAGAAGMEGLEGLDDLQDLVGGDDDGGGFPGPRASKGPSAAEMTARVDAKKKRRDQNKKAAKARKKNR